MGAGKSTVGRMLGRKLNRRFIDSDHALEERCGVKIPTIFEMEGEVGFRKRESQIIDETGKPSVTQLVNTLLMQLELAP